MEGKFIVIGYNPDEYEEAQAVGAEMWYDRHFRHWVIYPVDAEGNQLEEARYGFGKKEAERIRKEILEEKGIA